MQALRFVADQAVQLHGGNGVTEENAVGKCVMRAMKAVIVPAYTGSEQTVQWEVDLTGAKKSGPAGGEAKEGEAKGGEEK